MNLSNHENTYEYVIKYRDSRIDNRHVQCHSLSIKEKKEIEIKILHLLKENKIDELQELIRDDFTDYGRFTSNNKREILEELRNKGYISLEYCYCPIYKIDKMEQSVLLWPLKTPEITQQGLKYLISQ